jgi:ATP-dependent exoDNAse (exonuclease V) beta subunit
MLQASAGSSGLGSIRIQYFGEEGETIKDHVAREAAAIGREVRRLLEDPGVNKSDIAILVRRRTHAKAYVRALNEQGISAALDRRSGLFVTDEVRDALAWMSWIVDLEDDQAAVRVLQSPSCGLSDATMIALADRKEWLAAFLADSIDGSHDGDTRTRLDLVRTTLSALLSTVGIPLPQAVRQILRTLPIAAGYVRLGETVGAQAIANLRGFEELAYAFAQERPSSHLTDFVDDVKRRILYDDDAQEAELDADGVRVLTIHQAKGLEWRFVFVACSTRAQYANAEPTDRVVAYDMASGAFALKNDIDGRETFHWTLRCDEHDPETGERIKPGPRARAHDREQARVFYVAVTRARERVYVSAPALSTGSRAARFLAPIQEWADRCEPGVDLSFDREPAPALTPGIPAKAFAQPRLIERLPSIPKLTAAPIRPRISFTAISTFEICPRKARLRYRLHLPDLREATPRFVGLDGDDASTPTNAARLGSLAHRALELWGRARIGGQPIDIADAFVSASYEFADATPEEQERAKASAAQGAIALADYTVLDVETPFKIVFGDTSVEGVIDLIARDPQHRLVIIDYKTGRTEADHYALQMSLYHRVASERYPQEDIHTAILRLSPSAASFTAATALTPTDLEKAIAEVGFFESDVANVGLWCDSCSYKGSPCTARGVA